MLHRRSGDRGRVLSARALHLRRLLRRARPQRGRQGSGAPRQVRRTDPVPPQHRREHRRRSMRRPALPRQGHRRRGIARHVRGVPRREVQAQGETRRGGDGGADGGATPAGARASQARRGKRGEAPRRQGARHRDDPDAGVPALQAGVRGLRRVLRAEVQSMRGGFLRVLPGGLRKRRASTRGDVPGGPGVGQGGQEAEGRGWTGDWKPPRDGVRHEGCFRRGAETSPVQVPGALPRKVGRIRPTRAGERVGDGAQGPRHRGEGRSALAEEGGEGDAGQGGGAEQRGGAAGTPPGG
mmetsp:Transcript_9332/g.37842  ORF Transcript_9332/g.37842 Transcript_9332/m.37842 type:complete len:296 (+) Transcript_9332:73-960(+)